MIRFEPLPGKTEAFRKELLRVCKCTGTEPSCLGIDAFESVRKPFSFAIHSEWASETAFEHHAKLPHTRRFLRSAGNCLTHPIQGLRLRRIEDDNGTNPMHQRSNEALVQIRDVLLETYAVNDAMNQLVLSHLDPCAWRAQPPGANGRRARTIAAIFAHLHNNRLSWLRNSAPHLKRPAPLNPDRCSMKQAAVAHRKSAAQCLRMLTDALSGTPKCRVVKFSRGSWAPTWPAGGTMFAYMFSHEAHHRGQILMLAQQLGCGLPDKAAYGIWWWDKLWKQHRFANGPR
jgi:quinol monooxygenase YgiN/uncharacterized damage-inducible protein DinB